MKIGILGAGAMGLLYGAYLSQENEVTMICTNEQKATRIHEEGVTVEEQDGTSAVYRPQAVVDSTSLTDLDLVILFVKSGVSEQALESHRHLFPPETTLLTLQNGSGHEEVLAKFVSGEQLAIGISQDGSLLLDLNRVRHTGRGKTYFGKPMGDTETMAEFEKTCIQCGFDAVKSSEIKFFIWEKLMINASSSVMSGVLGQAQGYCYTNEYAWDFVQKLVHEMVDVAKADGITFDVQEQVERLRSHLTTNPEGVPSICVDLRIGAVTEVESISGSVVRAGRRLGVATPTHEFVVQMVHAMERRFDGAS